MYFWINYLCKFPDPRPQTLTPHLRSQTPDLRHQTPCFPSPQIPTKIDYVMLLVKIICKLLEQIFGQFSRPQTPVTRSQQNLLMWCFLLKSYVNCLKNYVCDFPDPRPKTPHLRSQTSDLKQQTPDPLLPQSPNPSKNWLCTVSY